MPKHQDDVSMMRKAFKDAASMMKSSLGMPRDPDMANYQKLSEQDFADMMTEMGADQVLDYIKRMETRGMGLKEKKHG